MVVREIQDGTFIFWSFALSSPGKFWMAALQHAIPITITDLQLWECPYYPNWGPEV